MINVIPSKFYGGLTNGYYTRTSQLFVVVASALLLMAAISFVVKPYPYDPTWIIYSALSFFAGFLFQAQQMIETGSAMHDEL